MDMFLPSDPPNSSDVVSHGLECARICKEDVLCHGYALERNKLPTMVVCALYLGPMLPVLPDARWTTYFRLN